MKTIALKDKENPTDDIKFWKEKTPEERLSAVETLREQFYAIQGCKSIPRLKRVLRLVER